MNLKLINHNFSRRLFTLKEVKERVDEGKMIIKSLKVSYPSNYILYCLSNCPSSYFYFDWRTMPFSVMDGNKRLRTLIDFYENKFSLDNGMYFDEIDGYLKFRLMNYELQSYISLENSEELKNNLQEQW